MRTALTGLGRVAGALAALAVLMAVAANIPSASAQGQQDMSQVQIKPTKISDNFYARVRAPNPQTADRFVGQVYAELKAAR
jgi:hypothetical protein